VRIHFFAFTTATTFYIDRSSSSSSNDDSGSSSSDSDDSSDDERPASSVQTSPAQTSSSNNVGSKIGGCPLRGLRQDVTDEEEDGQVGSSLKLNQYRSNILSSTSRLNTMAL
jgi:hypothetical protein